MITFAVSQNAIPNGLKPCICGGILTFLFFFERGIYQILYKDSEPTFIIKKLIIIFQKKVQLISVYYTFYKNGTSKQKVWNANRFKETSGVGGNLSSRSDSDLENGKNSGLKKF
jgi:hypothetical protein